MKKLLLVPALLFAACGDNLHPDLDQAVVGAEDDTGAVPETPSDSSLAVSFRAAPASCDNGGLSFEGAYSYADGSPVSNPICHYDFGDGTSAATCDAVHLFAAPPANVTFTVTDPATGATGSFADTVIPPGVFDAWLIPSTDGLSISWEAHAFYTDGYVGIDHVSIEPADKVILDDPSVLNQGVGTVRVTEPGTYVITLHAAIWPGVEGCYVDYAQTVEVTCNGDGHAQ
jgi:hypothetical protein